MNPVTFSANVHLNLNYKSNKEDLRLLAALNELTEPLPGHKTYAIEQDKNGYYWLQTYQHKDMMTGNYYDSAIALQKYSLSSKKFPRNKLPELVLEAYKVFKNTIAPQENSWMNLKNKKNPILTFLQG